MFLNAQTIITTIQGTLSLTPLLSHKRKTAMILPRLQSEKYILLGTLYDDWCDTILPKIRLLPIKPKSLQKKVKNVQNGLFNIPSTMKT